MSGALCVLLAGSQALSATINPGEAIGIGAGTVVTNVVFSTITGGVAPYLTTWVRRSGSTLIDPTDYTSQSTAFSSSGVTASTYRTALFDLQVTDAIGSTLTVGPVLVQIQGDL